MGETTCSGIDAARSDDMKLTLTLQHGSLTSEHQLELHFPQDGYQKSGLLTYVLDGKAGEANCVLIAPGVYSILLGGRSYEVRVAAPTRDVAGNPGRRVVTLGARHFSLGIRDPRRRQSTTTPAAPGGPQEILAPMPGKIVRVLVEKRQEVAPGAGLFIIEAMKMQNELRAARSGKVEEIYVAEGSGVEAGARLARLV